MKKSTQALLLTMLFCLSFFSESCLNASQSEFSGGGKTVRSNSEKVVIESARDIPVAFDVDVVVVGGTSGGVAAAVEAARQGASVFLVAARYRR